MKAGDSVERVILGHGSGGRLMHDLIRKVFAARFDNPLLRQGDDSARFSLDGQRLAFTTDSYVVKPLFFPGGDIGRLAVCGTVNDLATAGAQPLYLSAAFVIEEGLPLDHLERIVSSMQAAAEEAGVQVVTGDTKVVEKGSADGLFVNTAGLGIIPPGVDLSGANARPGDVVILSGTIGDHGIAVLSQREGFRFEVEVQSDAAPLNGLLQAALEVTPEVRVARDPTRGGLATTLNEIAAQSKVAIRLEESAIPVRHAVRAACEMLGYDPLYVANEGKLVLIVAPAAAQAVVRRLRRERYGEDAAAIGKVLEGPAGRVLLTTGIGGTRIVDLLAGEMLPRIC